MLPLARIREALRHPDADIRLASARYFHDAHDCGDATMADWWAVVDALGFAAARPLLHSLESLPDTAETFARLITEVRNGLPAADLFPLRRRLEQLPYPLLQRHIGELRDVHHLLTPVDLRHAEERLALASEPPETLWKKLLTHAAECAVSENRTPDRLLVSHLTEALARHPEFAAPRALAILHDDAIYDWREIFAIDLAGALRCREAIDPLIARLRIDTDYMLERARAALVRIGDASIPARLAANWETETWNFRNYAHGAIASFRREESAALLRDLIGREGDADFQIHIAVSLLEMLPDEPATLEAVRTLILSRPEEENIEALDRLLATVGTMAGWDFPERAEWRTMAIADEQRIRRLLQQDEGYEESVRAGMLAGLSFHEAGGRALGPLFDDGEDFLDEEAPALPFVREAPKIGRNDPCPCNSGRKYKKCCGQPA